MARRKNSHGAPVKLSDNQIQQIIKYLINENVCTLPLHVNPSIITAARLYNVTVKMIIDLINGSGRFKALFHTPEHKELSEFFKKKNCDDNNISTIKKHPSRRGPIKMAFSKEDLQKMVTMSETMNVQEIAKEFKCSSSTIARRIEEHLLNGGAIKPIRVRQQAKEFSEQEIKKAVEMMKTHKVAAVAKHFEVSTTVIYSLIRNHPDYVDRRTLRKSINDEKKLEQVSIQPQQEETKETVKEILEEMMNINVDINVLLSQKIDKVLKRVLVNPEIFGGTINLINSEFHLLQDQSISMQELNSIAIYRAFLVLKKVMNIALDEEQKVFSKLVGA